MGKELNPSSDLVPAEDLYKACKILSQNVIYKGDFDWDFSALHSMEIDQEFIKLVNSYLSSVLDSKEKNRGWKLPETTLVYPWIVRMFPDIKYIFWVRDPRDCVLSGHITDDLSNFNVPYNKTDDPYLNRIYSWKYHR